MVIVVLFSGGDLDSTEWIESFAALKIIYLVINGPVTPLRQQVATKAPAIRTYLGKMSILINFTFFIKR